MLRRRVVTVSLAFLPAVVTVFSSCAGTRSPAGAYAAGGLDVEPRLVACAGYREVAGGVTGARQIELQYVVRADGRVDPTSIIVWQGKPAPAGLVERGRTAAANCIYVPAERAGLRVAVMVRKVFRFPEEPAGTATRPPEEG